MKDYFDPRFAEQLDAAKKYFEQDFRSDLKDDRTSNSITFLGTGMSSWVTGLGTLTTPRTGAGARIVMDGTALHIDPGYLAASQARKYCGIVPVDGILVSHVHGDGCCGLQEMLFYARQGGLGKSKPTLVGNQTLVDGFELDGMKRNFLPNDPIFLSNLEKLIGLNPGEKTRVGNVEVYGTPCDHPEWFRREPPFKVSNSIGFRLKSSSGLDLSWVGETTVFGEAETHWGEARSLVKGAYTRTGSGKLDQIAEAHYGAQVLVVSIATLIPNQISPGNHLRIDGVYELTKAVKPKLVCLTDISGECDLPRMDDLSANIYDPKQVATETYIQRAALDLEQELSIPVKVMYDGKTIDLNSVR